MHIIKEMAIVVIAIKYHWRQLILDYIMKHGTPDNI